MYILAVLGAYLLGSIPFGLLVSQALGQKDPRTQGSKNIGFTNVLRVSGKKAGILTLLGDVGKGLAATGLALYLKTPYTWVLFIGLAVILGHIFSVFLKFKGGKGVATALGAVSGMSPFLGLYLLMVWLGAVILFKYSSGGALAAFAAFPLLAWFYAGDWQLFLFAVAVLALILYCHKDNIVRLLNGTESKIRLSSN